MELVHGNDYTLDVTHHFRDGKLLAGQSWEKHPTCPVGTGKYPHSHANSAGAFIPAQAGDTLQVFWADRVAHEFVVSEDDIARGYVIAGEYQGVKSGRLVHPIFLRPRVGYRCGNAAYPSRSKF